MRQGKRRRYWCGGNREPAQDAFFIAALDERLWSPGSAESWDSCWYTGMPDPDVFEALAPGRSINHIPGNNALTIKSYLARTLAAHRARVAGRAHVPAMDFFPETFHLPREYVALQCAAAADPTRRWLLKPANSSRGRDIRLLEDPAEAPREGDWIVQEYIARPHLRDGRKYVLRLYVLITSVDPLVAWLYEEGFQKLASEPYDPQDTGNLFAHLTNPDVNATNARARHPVVFVTLGEYRRWLREAGADDAALWRRIEALVRMTVVSAREAMVRRLSRITAETSGCYELLGIDCLVDADLKPWIMECNLSPSLEVCASPDDGGLAEEHIKRRLVADMVELLGLNASDQPPVTGKTTEDRILATFARQRKHAGGFRLVCPGPDPEATLSAFAAPRAGDIVLARRHYGRIPDLVFEPAEVGELYADDRVLLYAPESGRVIRLNEVASLLWLRLSEGEPITRIAAELAARSGDPWATAESVWSLLAGWAEEGLIRLKGSDPDRAVVRPQPAAAEERPARAMTLALDGASVRLRIGCPAARRRLCQALAPLALGDRRDDGADRGGLVEIAVLPASSGYAVAVNDELVTGPRSLEEVGLVLWQMLLAHAGKPGGLLLPGCLLPLADGRALVIASRAETGFETPGLALAGPGQACGALRLDLDAQGRLLPLALPLRVTRDGRRFTLAPASTGRPAPMPATAIAGVILPDAHADGLEEMSPAEAVAALAQELRGDAGRFPAPRLVERLEEWLAERGVYRLAVADLKAARRVLSERFPLPEAA